jgi:2-dehydro-3-deoxyphosphooctonate aldolase (KDO 8-P synthase)
MTANEYTLGTTNLKIGISPFVIAGPCVIESEEGCLRIAEHLAQLMQKIGLPIVFKASFDKANRSSLDSYRGPGLQEGLRILAKVRSATGLAVVTDIHETAQAAPAGEVVDGLQIPAFLCRQTDLLVACARTGKPVNVKKGQFLSPEEMRNVVNKLRASGNDRILLTERGTFFGYNRLVNDMGAIPAMRALGCPVVFDATHSTQQPGGLGSASGGHPALTPLLARAAIAAGADGLFLEVHPDPAQAKSDAACMLPLNHLERTLVVCQRVYQALKETDLERV